MKRRSSSTIPFGYKLSDDNKTLVQVDKEVSALSEIKDDLVIKTYNNIIEGGFKRTHPDLDRSMGYVNNVDSARAIIEKLYKSDSASKEPKKDL